MDQQERYIYIQPDFRWLASGEFHVSLRTNAVQASMVLTGPEITPAQIKTMVEGMLKERFKYPFWLGQTKYSCTYTGGKYIHSFTQAVGMHVPPPKQEQQQEEREGV
jgi:hypothetical protein